MSKPSATRQQRIQQKSSSRREQQKQALRKEILDAAETLFLEHGYEHFSLRQVAEAVGYSPTTIYNYFEDKDALLFEVVLEGFTHFGEMLQDAYSSHDAGTDRLEALGRAYIAFGLKYPVHYQLMFMQRGEFMTRPHPQSRSKPIDAFGVLHRAVEEALDLGVITPEHPTRVANLLWAGVHGIVSLVISMPSCDDTFAQDTAGLYFSTTLAGLQTPP